MRNEFDGEEIRATEWGRGRGLIGSKKKVAQKHEPSEVAGVAAECAGGVLPGAGRVGSGGAGAGRGGNDRVDSGHGRVQQSDHGRGGESVLRKLARGGEADAGLGQDHDRGAAVADHQRSGDCPGRKRESLHCAGGLRTAPEYGEDGGGGEPCRDHGGGNGRRGEWADEPDPWAGFEGDCGQSRQAGRGRRGRSLHQSRRRHSGN